jgi:hypothetical protein
MGSETALLVFFAPFSIKVRRLSILRALQETTT